MNAKRLAVGDQVVVKSLPEFAKNVVKRGDRARVAEVLKDGKKVQYRFRFDGYNNLGRKSRNPILLPRSLFERAALAIPQYGKCGVVPKRPKKERVLRVARAKPPAGGAMALLEECRGLMEELVGKLSVLERLSLESLAPLPGIVDGAGKTVLVVPGEEVAACG